MAAGTLPSPGKVVNGLEIGPCIDESCKHINCACTRKQATSICHYCGKPIGYETRFYNEREHENKKYVHAICLEDTIR